MGLTQEAAQAANKPSSKTRSLQASGRLKACDRKQRAAMRIGSSSLIKNQHMALPEGSGSSSSGSSPGAFDGGPRRCPSGSLPVPAWISMAAIPFPVSGTPSQDGAHQGSDTQHPQPPHVAPLAMLMSASFKHIRRVPSFILPRGRLSTVLPSSCAYDPRWQARLAKKALSVVQAAAAVTAGRLMLQEWKTSRIPQEQQKQHRESSAEQQQQQQQKGWGWLHKAAMDATAHLQTRSVQSSPAPSPSVSPTPLPPPPSLPALQPKRPLFP